MSNKVLHYFEEISKIPRSSGNEKQIANWLVNFAKEHNFEYHIDKYNNVLIKKGNNNHNPIVLQAHTDMVCIKDMDYDIDFLKDSIKLIYDGDFLKAYKTSLGADNGLGVAIILSLLDEDNDYNIEALFTSDEEVTMTGAINFDYSKLSSNNVISFDGFSDKEIITSCASICDMKINTTFSKIQKQVDGFKLVVSGLKGGHSGGDIHKNIGNAIKLTSEFLSNLKNLEIANFTSGKQFNFIPNQAVVTFTCYDNAEEIKENLNNLITKYEKDYPSLMCEVKPEKLNYTIGYKDTLSLISILNNLKTGVLVNGELGVVLSQNLACVDTDLNLIKISQRGHDISLEDDNIISLQELAKKYGFGFEIFDKQSGFVTNIDSTLVKKAQKSFDKLFNETPTLCTKHVSLEGGIISQHIPNFEFIVLSPKILDVHSTSERIYIPSIDKTYKIVSDILSQM